MRRTALTVFTIFLATALASSVLVFASSGSSKAEETSSGATELTKSPVSTSPGKKKPKADILPALKEEFPAYSDSVDNSAEERFEAPGWATESGKLGSYGEDYKVLQPSKEAEPARYSVKIPADDTYSVYAWWPEQLGKDASARLGVQTKSGTKWSTVDQGKDGGYWVPIGEYEMKKGDQNTIQVAPTSGGNNIAVADAIAVVRGVVAAPPEPPKNKIGDAAAGEKTFSAASTKKRIPRSEVMQRAYRQIGTPYGNNRCVARVQEDCSCFTRLVYQKWRNLPDSPRWQWRYGHPVPKSRIQSGDLLFFDLDKDGRLEHWDHVAMYVGHGYVIHANNYYTYRKVHKQKMKYLRGYWGAKRLNFYR